MTESIHLLVGPYVLDALDDTETIALRNTCAAVRTAARR